MTELEFVQEAGIGAIRQGGSRLTNTRREMNAMMRFLRANGFHEAADAIPPWLEYVERLHDNQMPFGV